MINVEFCRNGSVADVTDSYAACEKGNWVELVRCSECISSSGDNDSSGGGRGRKTSAKAIHLLVRPKATI